MQFLAIDDKLKTILAQLRSHFEQIYDSRLVTPEQLEYLRYPTYCKRRVSKNSPGRAGSETGFFTKIFRSNPQIR